MNSHKFFYTRAKQISSKYRFNNKQIDFQVTEQSKIILVHQLIISTLRFKMSSNALARVGKLRYITDYYVSDLRLTYALSNFVRSTQRWKCDVNITSPNMRANRWISARIEYAIYLNMLYSDFRSTHYSINWSLQYSKIHFEDSFREDGL